MDQYLPVMSFGSWILGDGSRMVALRGGDGDEPDESPVEALLARLNSDEPLNVEQLREIEQDLLRAFQDARAQASGAPDRETREQAYGLCEQIAGEGGVLDQVRTRITDVETEASEFDQRFEELAQRAGVNDAPAAGETPAPEAGDAPAPEAAPEPAGAAADSDAATPAPEPAAAAAVTAAAAARAAVVPRRAVVRAVDALRPTRLPGSVSLLASGDGAPRSSAEIMEAFIQTNRQIGRARPNSETRVPVLHTEWRYPTGRVLTASGAQNTARIEDALGARAMARYAEQAAEVVGLAVTSPTAASLTAAASICGPLAVDREIPTIGDDSRPVWDSLPTFGADGKGGVTWTPSPTLAQIDITDYAGVWTEADDDADPLVPKICGTIDCLPTSEARLEAIYDCLELTNFMQRYSMDQADAWMDLIRTQFARWADERVLAKFTAASTAVTFTGAISATIDILNMLDVAVARLLRRHRVSSMPLVWYVPDWLRTMMRVDLTKAMKYGSADESFALADATIESWIRVRGVRPVWIMDAESDAQRMAEAQSAGALLGLPATVVSHLFPEGTFIGLDGGAQDFGVVRDSVLNSQNKLRLFREKWENVYKRGSYQSLRITATVCPNGAVVGTQAPIAC